MFSHHMIQLCSWTSKLSKRNSDVATHEYGDCSFCGCEVKEEFVELDYRYKKQLYIFRDVPTGVCQQCGEKYLVASTALDELEAGR